jgi:hypothetical protein
MQAYLDLAHEIYTVMLAKFKKNWTCVGRMRIALEVVCRSILGVRASDSRFGHGGRTGGVRLNSASVHTWTPETKK